jgi:nucleoside-triphosphatase THEP1
VDIAQALPLPSAQKGEILVVTGPQGAGKTTFCQSAVEKYAASGYATRGLLSPGRFENGQKNAIFALDVEGRQARLLASQVPGEIDGLQFGAWTFDDSVFEWGNRALLRSAGADVLLIDELGYLEFDLRKGWMAGFDVLRAGSYGLAVVVIRPECIQAFSNMGFRFKLNRVLPPAQHPT